MTQLRHPSVTLTTFQTHMSQTLLIVIHNQSSQNMKSRTFRNQMVILELLVLHNQSCLTGMGCLTRDFITSVPSLPSSLKMSLACPTYLLEIKNVYFIIDNKFNMEKRNSKKRSAFADDRGIRNSSSGTSPKTYYLFF